MIGWAVGMWELQVMGLDPHGFWQLSVTKWGERQWKSCGEKGKLSNWGGREDHTDSPRCRDVYLISPLDFSSTFAIPPFLLRSFSLCQPLCIEWQSEGQERGWTLGPYYIPDVGVGTIACSVDGSSLYYPGPFPVPASRLIPNRPLPQSPFYSGLHGCAGSEVLHPFLGMFPEP